MSAISTCVSRLFRAFLLAIVAVTLSGCVGSITIEKPGEREVVITPPATKVVIAGKSYSQLSVTTDSRSTGHRDVSSAFTSMGPDIATADLNLSPAVYTITASGELPCWYCTNGIRHSNDSTTFIVTAPPPSCTRSVSTPVMTLPTDMIVASQTPGPQNIMTKLNGTDSVLILIDDAPGLSSSQMSLELDINTDNIQWNKAIEAWGACRSGSRVAFVEASMVNPGPGVGQICSPVTPANNYRSGCSISQTMQLNQSTSSEILFRKPTFAGVWGDTHVFDSSIWAAWGGRAVRIIWWTD